MALNPHDVRALSLGCGALILLGRQQQAREWLQAACALEPDEPDIRYNAACAYAMLGEHDRALDLLEALDGDHHTNRAWMQNDAVAGPSAESSSGSSDYQPATARRASPADLLPHTTREIHHPICPKLSPPPPHPPTPPPPSSQKHPPHPHSPTHSAQPSTRGCAASARPPPPPPPPPCRNRNLSAPEPARSTRPAVVPVKCAGKKIASVSAYCSSNRRRVTLGLRRILIREESRIGPNDLHRVMKTIAGEQRPTATALGNDTQVAWRMAADILQPDAIADLTVNE